MHIKSFEVSISSVDRRKSKNYEKNEKGASVDFKRKPSRVNSNKKLHNYIEMSIRLKKEIIIISSFSTKIICSVMLFLKVKNFRRNKSDKVL